MINEVVYCPRLFWLEHRAGLFADNAHTVTGQQAHGRVDQPGGPPIGAEDEGGVDVIERGTWLSSTSIGVTAKLDRVIPDAARPGCVIPIDTKKGRPNRDGELWPADEVQVVLQGMLLREAGHRVEQVAVFYAAEQRRVVVELTDTRVAAAQAAIERARQVQALDAPPPPLIDSPKCPGCSLNAICQPDEVNAITGRAAWDGESTIRRVIPEAADTRPLYITEPGAKVTAERRTLVIEPPPSSEAAKQKVGVDTVDHVCIIGTAQLTTVALRGLLESGVPVAFLSSSGWLAGVAVGNESRAIAIRMAQHRAWDTPAALAIARVLIADKIQNQRTILRRNADDDKDELPRLKRLAEECGDAANATALLALEAEAAKRYWSVFATLAGRDKPEFAMAGRTRRPPRDATNAMLSYCSGLLTKDCTLAARLVGLDPYLGVFHTPTHGRPSLALDLMEPFRPLIVDSTVLGVIRRNEVEPSGFTTTGAAVSMTKEARRALTVAYERRMQESITHPVFGYRITYRQVLGVQTRLLARALTGEIPAMTSFRTR
jgi:CRISPR-associated protein Cas1